MLRKALLMYVIALLGSNASFSKTFMMGIPERRLASFYERNDFHIFQPPIVLMLKTPRVRDKPNYLKLFFGLSGMIDENGKHALCKLVAHESQILDKVIQVALTQSPKMLKTEYGQYDFRNELLREIKKIASREEHAPIAKRFEILEMIIE